MVIVSQSNDLITNSQQLHSLLLDRVPADQRDTFFDVPHPHQLSADQHGIEPDALTTAQNRLESAISSQENVLIFGDYDCDGITATAILWEALKQRGLVARPFLPHREKHGYGISVLALEEIWQSYQPDLVITVDNGIVAHEAIAWLRHKGVDVILTDHHAAAETLPDATVILHSTRLCGASVSWFLADAIDPDHADKRLDLAVLGTFADQVPLLGANRSFAFHGLEALRTTRRLSLLSLASSAGVDLRQATADTIHFALAPRINALGRIGDPMDALRALVSQNPQRMTQLIHHMETTNRQRQQLVREAVTTLDDSESDLPLNIVVGDFHEGIIGLIAGRLTEQTAQPSIVFSIHGDTAKASVRSPESVDIIAWLRQLEDRIPFLSLGGHAQAAGFSVPAESLETSLSVLREQAAATLVDTNFEPNMRVLGPLHPQLLSVEALTTIEAFGPFGAHHESPLFALHDVNVQQHRPVGKNKSHWQLKFRVGDVGSTHQAIFFRAAEKMQQPAQSLHSLIIQLQRSTFSPSRPDIIIRHAE